MEGHLKLSTAVNVAVLMIDSSDHIAGKAGLTLTIKASKAGAAFATITPTVTELESGWYALALTTTHSNTLGDFALHITASGADPNDVKWQVSTYLPGEAATLQADQAVNTTKVGGTTQTAGDIFARIGAPAGASVSADIAAVKVDTAAVKVKTDFLPSATAGAAGGVFIAGSNAATSANITGNLTGNVSGSVASVTADVGITQAGADKVWGSATRTLSSFGTLVADVASAVWAAATRLLTAGTNIVLAKGVGVTGFNDLSAAQVNTEADTALADVGVTTTVTGRIDAAISSRLAAGSYTAPDNSSITAIKAKTDNLPAAPAAVGDIPTAAQNADKLLGRNLAGAADGGRTVTDALRPLRNKTTIAGGVLTVKAEDDSTTAWTAAVTTAPGDPLTAIDPV